MATSRLRAPKTCPPQSLDRFVRLIAPDDVQQDLDRENDEPNGADPECCCTNDEPKGNPTEAEALFGDHLRQCRHILRPGLAVRKSRKPGCARPGHQTTERSGSAPDERDVRSRHLRA